jgi:thioredoxin reductase (NADPH)
VNSKSFDVIIIGAGPIGLSCGIEAVKRNLSHLIIEKGCLVNSIFNYPTNMTFFSTSDRIEIGEVPFISHGDKPTRRESLEYYRIVRNKWSLKVNLYEEALDFIHHDDHTEVVTSKDRYFCRFLLFATGFYDNPNLLGVEGENLPKVKHYFDEPHPYIDHKLIVVGGGNSGVDVALETYRKGADVTMVIREPSFKDGIKYWVKPDIENRIAEGSIQAHFNSVVKTIREKEVDILTPDGMITVENDFVFAMTGYHTDFSLLQKAGISIMNNQMQHPCFNPETHQTNISNVFLAGVVCSGYETNKWFLENSRDHATKIFDLIEEKPAKASL